MSPASLANSHTASRSPLLELRERTAEDHVRAEEAANLGEALEDLAGYARALLCFYKAWRDLEAALSDHP